MDLDQADEEDNEERNEFDDVGELYEQAIEQAEQALAGNQNQISNPNHATSFCSKIAMKRYIYIYIYIYKPNKATSSEPKNSYDLT